MAASSSQSISTKNMAMSALIPQFQIKFDSANNNSTTMLSVARELMYAWTEQADHVSEEDLCCLVQLLLKCALRPNFNDNGPTLQDYLCSKEVSSCFQKSLCATWNSTIVVLGAMLDIVRHPNSCGQPFRDYGVDLINAWFVNDGKVVCPQENMVANIVYFMFSLGTRQAEIVGHRIADLGRIDDILAPIVLGCLGNETETSINIIIDNRNTSLFYVACGFYLPKSTEALISHPNIFVNHQNKFGMTPLVDLVHKDKEITPPFQEEVLQVLLKHPKINIILADAHKFNIISHLCIHLSKQPSCIPAILRMMEMICGHQGISSSMLIECFKAIVTNNKLQDHAEICRSLVRSIIGSPQFKVDELIDEERSPAQMACTLGEPKLLEPFFASHFDPNIGDCIGNTLLFYICEYLWFSQAIKLVKRSTISWNFDVENEAGQNVREYYMGLAEPNTMLCKVLEGKCHARLPSIATVAAEGSAGSPPNSTPRQISWDRNMNPSDQVTLLVKSTTFAFYRDHYKKGMVYTMNREIKGKVCIITVSRFTNGLPSLDSYKMDTARLLHLWRNLGFDTYQPVCNNGSHQLTAKEIENAVTEFSGMLTREDECAVLCIMSHGKEEYVYGSDGKFVSTGQLIEKLDNHRCINMATKPKVVIIQACQGSRADGGVHVRAGGDVEVYVPAADPGLLLPTISDVILCLPSAPGYYSYVNDEGGDGSVFIRNLTKIFAENAHEEDINGMLTMVNQAVAKEVITVRDRTTANLQDNKQMPVSHNFLTKKLYFFPKLQRNTETNRTFPRCLLL